MKKPVLKFLPYIALLVLLANLSGCAELKRKFTPKKKPKPIRRVYNRVEKYDIKPSMELYEKHYIFWINWHRELLETLGENFKSDVKCSQEITANTEDMATLLVDKMAAGLTPHVEALRKVEIIIDKRNMTKANETRIRRILEREYRAIKRKFSPKEMKDYIRKEWKTGVVEELIAEK